MKKNILLIDDESSITDALENRFYDRFGRTFTVHVANDFFRAREFLDKQEAVYDLIISDLLLPTRGANTPNCYQGTTLAGWFFLYHHMFTPKGTYYKKNTTTKVILFSAYESVWNQYIRTNNLADLTERVSFIRKDHIYNNTGGYTNLLDRVEELLM